MLSSLISCPRDLARTRGILTGLLLPALLLLACLSASAQTQVRLVLEKSTLRPGEATRAYVVLVSGALSSTDTQLISLLPSPGVGSIIRVTPTIFGYTAPSSITTTTYVTLTLRIGANIAPTSATVMIQPATSSTTTPSTTTPSTTTPSTTDPSTSSAGTSLPTLSINPSSLSLVAGSTVTYQAQLNGLSTSNVTWRLEPSIGNITSQGVYVAPAAVSSPTLVQVKATYSLNTAVTASASLQVVPNTQITVSPSAATIAPGASATFQALVTGNTNTGVSWRISPAVGSINGGIYTAPASVTSATNVTISATSNADPTRIASATVTINPPPATTSAITLPLEIMGANGTVTSAQFVLNSTQAASARNLYLQIHDLDSQLEGSFQINSSPWIALTDATYLLQKLDAAYGGIGGGFSTVRGTVVVNPLWFVDGVNTIRFRFNQTDGVTSGYRVLNFNVRNASGANLIPGSVFREDDPRLWTAPYSDATSIARGKDLWYQANLTIPTPSGARGIKAKCSDCHAQDGRDLKYFNYSNFSIRSRAQFHGLTSQQGDQIASYIRTLAAPAAAKGRPWNPPYQPGPGLDSRPVSEWAAGAGLEWVLDRDRDSLPYIFPGGFEPSRIMPTANLSAREVPVALQLLDWNRWLPTVHPRDAFVGFDASSWNQIYLKARNGLVPNQVSSYLNMSGTLNLWRAHRFDFMNLATAGWPWNKERSDKEYSSVLWQLTKQWELNQEFGLESMARAWFGPQADERAWASADAFAASPFMNKIPVNLGAIANGKVSSYDYFNFTWYHLQLILNHSNKTQYGTTPIDWPYSYAQATNGIGRHSPQASILFIWLAKALQISENGKGPELGSAGWSLGVNRMDASTHYVVTAHNAYGELTNFERARILSVFWRAWIDKVSTFAPSQFYEGRQTSPTDVPGTVVIFDGNMPSRTLYAIQMLTQWGVDATVVQDLRSWAKRMWPNYAW